MIYALNNDFLPLKTNIFFPQRKCIFHCKCENYIQIKDTFCNRCSCEEYIFAVYGIVSDIKCACVCRIWRLREVLRISGDLNDKGNKNKYDLVS